MSIQRVRKRDGREVPFEIAKIADAVGRAQAAVGEDDPQFASEVAQLVELALARRAAIHGPGLVPDIEEIQDLVERALIELGRSAVAKAYILYRDRRARIRAALEVHGRAAERPDSAHGIDGARHVARAPRVQLSDSVAPWSKARIVAALMNEADLPRATAEKVAARVEQRVFDSGLRRLSTALIRELVDNELVDLGLARALHRQRSFGLSKHDLRRQIVDPDPEELGELDSDDAREPRRSAHRAERSIARSILRRFVLEDVMPEALAELHLAGDLSIEDVARPHLPLAHALPCELLLSGEPTPAAAFRALDEIAGACATCTRALVLDDCDALFQVLTRGRGAAQAGLAAWLRAVSALSQSSGVRVDFCARTAGAGVNDPDHAQAPRWPERAQAPRWPERAHAPRWIVRLLEELDALREERAGNSVPRVFLDAGELSLAAHDSHALRNAAERLARDGCITPTFGSGRDAVVGPGLVRRARERGALTCGAAIALNLPRLARRAGAWRDDALLEALSALVEQALDALVVVRDLQRADSRAPRARVAYALTPVGLHEALRWLGDGEVRAEQGTRVLGFLGEAAQRFGQARGLSVVVTPHFGEGAARRFAVLDAELSRVVQPLLFADDAVAARVAPYSCGFDVGRFDAGPRGNSATVAAALLSTQRAGAIHPPSLLAALAQRRAELGDEFPVLSALEELEHSRARLRVGSRLLYALPRADLEEVDLESAHAAPDSPVELFPDPVTTPGSPANALHISGTQHS
jgi:hypothetical protein